MSAGRGRNPNMRQQPQDYQNSRRELRRPMGGGDEELARGMGRMDPFGYGGQYGGNNSGRYGQFEPPRPAPNADGWSSGDDFMAWNEQQQFNNRTPAQSRLQFNQQQFQQQQQQQQQRQFQQWGGQAPSGQSWNIGASEFVPKSNLSISAEEFVPRTMARNTSQWAYQQQQQAPDYSTQPYGYQPHQEQPQPQGGGNYGYNSHPREHHHQYMPSEMSSGPPMSMGAESGAAASLYDPVEALSDAIATIVFMPSKFDRTTFHLAEKFNASIHDSRSLSDLVEALVEQCLQEEQFHCLAGRMCSYMAQNVKVEHDGCSFKSLLIQKCESLASQMEDLAKSDEKRMIAFTTILADIYLGLVSSSSQTWKVHDSALADLVTNVLTSLFNSGSSSHVALAAQKLKLCGKTLEGEEKFSSVEDPNQDEGQVWSDQPAPKMDALVSLAESLLTSMASLSDGAKADLKLITDSRSSDKWAVIEAENARVREEAAKIMVKAAPKKSAAIRIEPDPNDKRTLAQPEKPKEKASKKFEGELTEEELNFISDEIGEEDCSDFDEEDDGGMTDDIANAYEQFLAEQGKNGK